MMQAAWEKHLPTQWLWHASALCVVRLPCGQGFGALKLGLLTSTAPLFVCFHMPSRCIAWAHSQSGKDYGPHAFIVQLRELATHLPSSGITVGDIGEGIPRA